MTMMIMMMMVMTMMTTMMMLMIMINDTGNDYELSDIWNTMKYGMNLR